MNMIMTTFTAPSSPAIAGASRRSAGQLQAVLRRLNLGVAILDEDGAAVSVNSTLQAILESADRLVLRAGRVAATVGSENTLLQRAIRRCSSGSGDPDDATDVTIRGSSVDAALVVSVCPVDDGPSREGCARPVMLLVVDTRPASALGERFLKMAFELTDAEAIVARGLLDGATLCEIAVSRGVSLHTARTQLKSIMQKVGVSRQSELVNVLSRCDSVLRPDRPAA